MNSEVFKVKIDEKETELYFDRPTQDQLFQIDKVYRIAYAECLREGILTEAEARDLYEKNGAWTKDHEEQIGNISLEIAKLETILNGADPEKDHEVNMKLIEQISERRAKLFRLIGRRTDLLQKTAEALSNEQRMHKFIELCCLTSSDNNLFDSHDMYKTFVSKEPEALSTILSKAYAYEYSLPEDLSAEWAETKYLEKNSELIKKKEAKPTKTKKKYRKKK